MRQLRELTRLFYRRFLENDLICLDGDTTATLANVLGLVAAPGIFFPMLEYWLYALMNHMPLYYRDLYALPEKALYIGFSMTLLGLITVLEWDTLLPDQRDYTVLRPFPVRLGAILAAKVAALAGLWAVFTVAINGFSTAAFPAMVVQRDPLANLLWFIRAHGIAIVAANAFIFLAIISVQGILMNLLGWRWFRRVSPYAQCLLIALLLAMFFSTVTLIGGRHPAVRYLPPAWFVGLYQCQLGWTWPLFRELADLARLALGFSALAAVAGFALSYQRHVRRSLEVLDTAQRAPGPLARLVAAVLDRVVLRTPAERAAFHFVRQTVVRSRSHRALAAAWAGAGFALVFQALAGVILSGNRTWWQQPAGVLLTVPLVLAFFLLCGLRYVFTVPAELRANWLFQLAATGQAREYMPGVRKAVMVTAILPLFGALLPLHAAIWGWRTAAVHVVFGCLVAYVLMELLLAGFDKLPLTCSYVPGKANVKSLWSIYLLGFLAYVTLFAALERLVLADPARLVWAVAVAAAVRLGLRRPRPFTLVFDERPEPAVRTLDILQP